MSSLKIRQADGTFRDILMIKGDKGDTGVATEAINDALIDTEHTWSSSKINGAIPTTLPANGGNADTVGGKRVADFMQRFIKTGKIETFDTIIDSGIYRINEFDESLSIPTGMEQYGQLLVLNGENSDTVTQIYSNYSNNTMFFRSCSNWGKLESDWTSWDKLVNSTYVANNLTTNQEGYVLDARQGKSLKDSVDTINNNLASISNEIHSVNSLADDVDFNGLLSAGWYNTYSSVNAPVTSNKVRYNVKVERIAQGSSITYIQTAYFNMGGAYTKPKQRHTYYTLEGQILWSEWY